MIQGAIFDMDGVLLDNLEYHLEAFLVLGQEQGKELTREAILRTFGRTNNELLPILLDRELNSAELDALAIRKEELYRDLIAPHLEESVVPGLIDLLKRLTDDSFRVAVATSGPKENVDFVLNHLNLRGFFNGIVTGEQVRKGKPDPEAFLTAAERISLAPSECVVFEDSLSGVKAGLAAGCKCIALATTHPRDELLGLSPHRVIDDFRNLSLEQIRSL